MATVKYEGGHLPGGWALKLFGNTKMEQVPKVVCVTNGTSYLGLWIALHLLQRGYIVRLTVDNSEELQKLKEMEEFEMHSNRVMGVVGSVAVEEASALSEMFDGCYGVFHTSSFVDPYCVSGFTEHMTKLEVKGAEKVVEACSLTSSVRRLVFTSSLAACIWHSQGTHPSFMVDENCWSDPCLCREKKLWYALAKTMAEKEAWRVAGERGGVKMVSICPAFLTGPAFSSSSISTSPIAYLKGAREMYERGVLATADASRTAEAHVSLYEQMGWGGASGRYICFHSLINFQSDALILEKTVNMEMGFALSPDTDDSRGCLRRAGRIASAKLTRTTATSVGFNSCLS